LHARRRAAAAHRVADDPAHGVAGRDRPRPDELLALLTDRRTYHIELRATASTYMASVSWTYPQDALIALRTRLVKMSGRVGFARICTRAVAPLPLTVSPMIQRPIRRTR
jgi:hypothetical protein